uniref:Uncharacterized protein n=1 Tax=Oryza sativa subsp. japonica TaxID=39947 RepID=Q7XI94_ORYSJ|nr:hypothetical protein [Oryza sativa Japonica Group]BAD30488.1 hypothetical protein [Oryza sativa Japonica Group]
MLGGPGGHWWAARWRRSGGFGEAAIKPGGRVDRAGGEVVFLVGKTQFAKASLFPFRSHRSDSTWRPTDGVAEVAWVSVQGSGGRVRALAAGSSSLWSARLILFGELLPFSVGSFFAGWRRWSVYKENSGCRGNVVPCLDSLGPHSTGMPACSVAEAAWVSALAKVGAVAVLSLAGREAGRRRGVGRVWRKPCAADV